MAQTWNLPIDATDLLSDSRVDINDGFTAVKTNFIGPSDPTALFEDGFIWVNTTSNQVKARISGATVVLGDWTANLGHIRKDGTVTFTGNQNMGGFQITNLADPGSNLNWAARVNELQGRLLRAGDTMTGFLTLSADPVNTNHAATKNYADTKVAKSGDTMTGRLTIPASPAATAGQALRKDEIEVLNSFSVPSGHNHNGVNSRKVTLSSIDTTGLGVNTFPTINGAGNFTLTPVPSILLIFKDPPASVVNNGNQFSYADVNVASVTSGDTVAVWLKVTINASPGGGIVSLRKNGAIDPPFWSGSGGTNYVPFPVPVDGGQIFEWKVAGLDPGGNVDIDLYAYFKRTW